MSQSERRTPRRRTPYRSPHRKRHRSPSPAPTTSTTPTPPPRPRPQPLRPTPRPGGCLLPLLHDDPPPLDGSISSAWRVWWTPTPPSRPSTPPLSPVRDRDRDRDRPVTPDIPPHHEVHPHAGVWAGGCEGRVLSAVTTHTFTFPPDGPLGPSEVRALAPGVAGSLAPGTDVGRVLSRRRETFERTLVAGVSAVLQGNSPGFVVAPPLGSVFRGGIQWLGRGVAGLRRPCAILTRSNLAIRRELIRRGAKPKAPLASAVQRREMMGFGGEDDDADDDDDKNYDDDDVRRLDGFEVNDYEKEDPPTNKEVDAKMRKPSAYHKTPHGRPPSRSEPEEEEKREERQALAHARAAAAAGQVVVTSERVAANKYDQDVVSCLVLRGARACQLLCAAVAEEHAQWYRAMAALADVPRLVSPVPLPGCTATSPGMTLLHRRLADGVEQAGVELKGLVPCWALPSVVRVLRGAGVADADVVTVVGPDAREGEAEREARRRRRDDVGMWEGVLEALVVVRGATGDDDEDDDEEEEAAAVVAAAAAKEDGAGDQGDPGRWGGGDEDVDGWKVVWGPEVFGTVTQVRMDAEGLSWEALLT